MTRRAAVTGGAAAVLTLAALLVLARLPVEIAPGSGAWRRLVRGPTADGIVYPGAPVLIAFPDLPRGGAREIVLDGVSLDAAPSVLTVAVDGAAPVTIAVDARRAARVAAPAARRAGLRIEMAAVRGAPPARLNAVRVSGGWPPVVLLLLTMAAAALVAAGVTRAELLDGRAALALSAVAAAGAALFFMVVTGAVASGWPARALAVPALLLVAAIAAAARMPARAAVARAAVIVGAVAFGAGARWFFAPSAGSWDMEYWRAWTERALVHGVGAAYGPPLSAGSMEAAIRGAEPLFMAEHEGRRFAIDYPPLAIAAWRTAAAGVSRADAASWNTALKLPAVLGDLLAAGLLLFAWPRGRAGARSAALYWALPASWLSSATLGYLDGAYAPFVFAAAVAAGSGRAAPAGAALAVAALLKSTALVAAPAIAVALWAPRRLLIAVAAGLVVVATVLLPFVAAGTPGTAVAHVLSILRQDLLSGGYANPWWLFGALLSGEVAPVPYVHLALAPFPARAVGSMAFVAAAALICRALARAPGTRATVAAGGALFAAYGILGVGVHVNHPHPVVLLFLAAALPAPAWRWPAWVLIHGYAADVLLVEQLGRLAGPRYGPLDQAGAWLDRLRLWPGFDLTLVLAVAHTAAFAVLLGQAGAWQGRRQVDDRMELDKLDERVKYRLE